MKLLSRVLVAVSFVTLASSAFAAGNDAEKYVRQQLSDSNSELSKDLKTKMADYDARHIPDTTTAKASDYTIKARLLGSGHAHYRHTNDVTRYLVSIEFEVVRIGERLPVEYVISVDKMEMEDGSIEFQSSEGTVY